MARQINDLTRKCANLQKRFLSTKNVAGAGTEVRGSIAEPPDTRDTRGKRGQKGKKDMAETAAIAVTPGGSSDGIIAVAIPSAGCSGSMSAHVPSSVSDMTDASPSSSPTTEESSAKHSPEDSSDRDGDGGIQSAPEAVATSGSRSSRTSLTSSWIDGLFNTANSNCDDLSVLARRLDLVDAMDCALFPKEFPPTIALPGIATGRAVHIPDLAPGMDFSGMFGDSTADDLADIMQAIAMGTGETLAPSKIYPHNNKHSVQPILIAAPVRLNDVSLQPQEPPSHSASAATAVAAAAAPTLPESSLEKNLQAIITAALMS